MSKRHRRHRRKHKKAKSGHKQAITKFSTYQELGPKKNKKERKIEKVPIHNLFPFLGIKDDDSTRDVAENKPATSLDFFHTDFYD